MSKIAQTLGAFVAGAGRADVPAARIDAAHRAILDVAGVTYAGIATPFATLVRETAAADFRDGPSGVLGTALRLAPAGAAHVNAVAAHALDFDANFNTGMVFAPAILFSAILATGEAEGVSGADAVTAFAVGTEICRVLGAALSEAPYRKDRDGLFYRGWFNSAVLGPIGAAAAVASLLKLDAETASFAIAIATVQAGGLRNAVGTDIKPYLCGRAAEIGLRAAYLARGGAKGPIEAFEGARGLIQVVGGGRWTPEAFAGLGGWGDPGTSFKLYPACSSIQAAAEAFEHLLDIDRIDRARVARVYCDVTRHIGSNLAFPHPTNVTEAQFSMQFAIGCVLAHGRFTADLLTPATLKEPAVMAAMEKVEMRVSPALDTEEIRRDGPEATEVTIETLDGVRYSHFQLAASGKPNNPVSDALLDAKFRKNLAPFAAPDRVVALATTLRNLADWPSLRGLFEGFAQASMRSKASA
jgi:2-methylcitrate dehydratase PrpD